MSLTPHFTEERFRGWERIGYDYVGAVNAGQPTEAGFTDPYREPKNVYRSFLPPSDPKTRKWCRRWLPELTCAALDPETVTEAVCGDGGLLDKMAADWWAPQRPPRWPWRWLDIPFLNWAWKASSLMNMDSSILQQRAGATFSSIEFLVLVKHVATLDGDGDEPVES